MRSLADRRAYVRMEVVGALWGALELAVATQVVNISTSGVLLESPIPAAQESTQPLTLRIDGNELTVTANVRRVEQVNVENSQPRYYIGLEFVAPPLRLLHAIQDLDHLSGR
jgi:hypothetical protein